jgi:outer membrane receptor protein involved in Fe transport
MKYPHKQFCIALVFLFFCLTVSAQQTAILEGKITDAQTGEPLIGALLRAMPTNKGATTNDSGFYSLTIPKEGKQIITISYLGYKKFEFVYPIDGYPSCGGHYPINYTGIDFALEPEIATIDQVVITAGRGKQKLKNVTVSMELIKPYLFENRNNVNLDEGIDQIPSVSFIDGQASIRGGSGWSYGAGTRVLVMLDDMPMVSGDAAQAQWSYIPVENIDQVEVLKGASSVLYGSAALNGVINVRTKRPGDKPYTAVNLYSGVYDNPGSADLQWQGNRPLFRSGANIVHSQRWGRFDATLSANYLNDDGFRMGEPEKRGRFSLNTRYTPKKIKNMYYGVNGNFMSSYVGSFLLWESYKQGYTQLDSGHNLTNGTRYNIDPYVVFYTGKTRHSLRGRYFYLDNNVDNGDPSNNQSNTSNYYYGEYQVQHTLGKTGINITAGVASTYSVTNSPIFQGIHQYANIAPFLQLEKKWKKITLNAGGRYESFRLDDYAEAKPVLRAGINYEAAKATFLRASYGQGYRFPSIVESYVKTSAGPLQVYPNPGLRSESGWNAELAIKQGFKIGKFIGFVDVAGFWTEYNSMMEFNFGQWGPNLGFQNLLGLGFSSINVGRARVNGIDISIGGDGKIGKTQLTVIGGYTYMNPTSLDPDKVYGYDINNNPLTYHKSSSDTTSNFLKYRFNHLAKLDVQLTYKRWMWGASARYNSYIKTVDRFFTDPLFAQFVGGINEGRAATKKGSLVLDYRMSYEINTKLKAGFIINNFLNNVYMTRPADLHPPRMFIVQLNYKVGK